MPFLLAALVQSYYLTRPGRGMRSFWGNLIGPAVYTAIEFSIEGSVFFDSRNHIAYWIYAAALGGLRASRTSAAGTYALVVQVVENVTRASILLGSMGVRFYEVIGDTVNTAKRLESNAGPGEVLISAVVAERVPHAAQLGTARLVAAKGKQLPIEVYPLLQ